MKIKFAVSLLDLDDNQLVKDGKPMTLGMACIEALMAMTESDRSESGESKLQRFELACSINKALKESKELDLTPENIALIKRRVGEGYGPLIVGQAYKLLNG